MPISVRMMVTPDQLEPLSLAFWRYQRSLTAAQTQWLHYAKTIILDVDSTDTVEMLKSKLQDKARLPVDQQQ